MHKLVCAALFFASFESRAQNYFHSTYGWEKTPVNYTPTDSEKKSDLVIVSEKRITEIAYDSDGQAVAYETSHIIYHVNSAKAIDGVNKGYMALSRNLEEIDLKARCISPTNKVTYFNKSTIKSVDNLENAGPYKIFAIDGVEVGCDVEILYTNKKQYSSYHHFLFKSSSPISNYEARIISPKNLVFETKTYNGLENFKSDASDSTKNHLYLIQKDIPPAEHEKYSAGQANYMKYIYQLAYNTNNKKSKIFNWDIISREFYTSLYVLEKDERKALEKVLIKNNISDKSLAEEKIKTLDSFIKTQFEISERYNELTFEKALENKKLGNTNAMKFYIGALKQIQIPFELVVSSERNDLRYDPKFPSYVFMKEFVIYFPDQDKFLSPLSLYSRLGYPEPDLLENNGLFIKEVNIGDISSSSAKTKHMQALDYKSSYHNFEVKATLDFNNKTTTLDVTQKLFGYLSFYVQPVYRYLNKEQKEELHKNYELSANSEGVISFSVQNIDEPDLYSKPMIIKFNSEQNDFLESAGNKFIFKAGLLIGPQAELYQEEKRKSDADMNYPHYMARTLEINIPAGYKATNLSDLNIDKVCVIDGQDVASFKSAYEVKDNKIIINVYEDYRVVNYPIAIFDSFKNVINAAADFNKKTLIFEKL